MNRTGLVVLAALLFPLAAHAAELRKETAEAFARYIQASEARMDEELRDAPGFLWIDRRPAAERDALYAKLRQGQVFVEQVEMPGPTKIKIPHGLVHDWVAVGFVPGVSLQQTVALLQNYNLHQEIYKPDIQRSKLLSANDDDFKVYFRLYRKTIVTVLYDAEFDIRYFSLDAHRVYTQGHATRIAEVENAGQPDERQKPVGNDRGYLWRLNTYWRLEEKDGGVYVQLEFVALSRGVPWVFAWLVNPLLKSVPRDYLTHALNATRTALTKPATASAPAAPGVL